MGSFLVGVLGLGLGGCVTEASEAVGPEAERDARGDRRGDEGGWRDLALVPFDPAAEMAAARAAGASASTRAALPIGERSRAELAQALRPVVLKPDGNLYIGQEPAWAAADAALAHASGASIERDPPFPSPVAPGLEGAAARIFGGDERVMPGNTTIAPYNGNVRIEAYADPWGTQFLGQCTGAYIGPWTVILSAKCLRLQNGGIAQRLVFQPARQGGALPFGSFDCRNGDPDPNNNFAAAIPVQYAVSQQEDFNFAVIDVFPCHSAPRWFNGYVVNAPDGTFSTFSYPFLCPGAGAVNTQLCGMSGSAWNYGWTLESFIIDTDDAGSGAAWYQTDTHRVAGTDVGFRVYNDFGRCGFNACQRNAARRIDGTYDSFIKQFAFDF